MADAVPAPAPMPVPVAASVPAPSADGSKSNRRSRSSRGGGDKSRAAESDRVAPKGGRSRPPRGAPTAGEATAETPAAAGDGTPATPARLQHRERKPRERKPKADAPAGAVDGTPPPASGTRDAKPAKKPPQRKSEHKKREASQDAEAAAALGEEKAPKPQDQSKKKNAKKPRKTAREEGDGETDDEEKEQEEEQEDAAVDWSTAAWFSGCDADLGTGYWLLTRSYACNDAAVLASEALVRRAVALQKLHARLKTELLPQDDAEEEDGEQDGAKAKATRQEWTTEEILDAAVAAVPPPVESDKPPASSVVVSVLEGEVVDAATELLIGRVGRESLALLVRWEAHLASLLPEPSPESAKPASAKGEAQGTETEAGGGALSGEEDQEEDDEDEAAENGADGDVDEVDATAAAAPAEPGAVVLPPPRQRRRRNAGAANSAFAHAKAQVTAAIAFHRSYEKLTSAAASENLPDASAEASAASPEAQWTQEITAIFEATRVTAADEAKRKGVAAQIETAFRRSPHWRHHEVLLFGSSLSKFGSKTSDLDLCLRATNVDPEDASATMSVRELKLRMRRTQQQQDGSVPADDGTSRNDDAPFLKELLDKSLKTVEALANALAKQRKKTVNKSDAKLQPLALLSAHWRALVVALEFFRGKLLVGGGADSGVRTQREAKAAAAAYHAALHKQQKKRQKDIYAASALLTRNGCGVDLVVAHARVPVIGFTHRASGFECDLCFENYHACVNTLLLRTYAECDDRARMLGIAIKHWAKRRGLNDASLGYLSSYSFILLVIYFLQHKARLLPNLQHPELLREANVEPVKLKGVDVSFCGAVAKARAFHAARLETQQPATPALNDATVTVGSLLLAFFGFYVEEFDFSQHVVSVRHPEQPMAKRSRWGKHKLKTWRFSIEDPLELDRDLGSVLQFRCQQRIATEMKRALKLLRGGKSFEKEVCAADPDTKKNESGKKATKKATKKDKRGGGGAERHGKRDALADATKQATTARDKDGSRGAPPRDGDKKPVSSRERRSDRHPARENSAPISAAAPAVAKSKQQGEAAPRERGSHEKGGRRGPRGDGAKSKDVVSAPKPADS